MATLLEFAEVCEKIKSTTSKNQKVSILANYLLKLSRNELPIACRLLTSKVFPPWDVRAVNISYSTISDAIKEITEVSEDKLKATYIKYGDLGEAAEELMKGKKITTLIQNTLTLQDVYSALDTAASKKGEGATEVRLRVLKGLLALCSPIEAKYLVKVLCGEMRIGLDEGLLEEALAAAYGRSLKQVRETGLVVADIGESALVALDGNFDAVKLSVFHPTNFMLAEEMPSPQEVADYFRCDLYAEYKYDGVRAQIHSSGKEVRIFSRRLEDVTNSFPEFSKPFSDKAVILDGEIVPYKDAPLPFQMLQRRLHRKEITKELLEETPVVYFAFDILYYNGETYISRPLRERRMILEGLNLQPPLYYANQIKVKLKEDIEEAFEASLKLGYEGLVIKHPDSVYTPGKRGKKWVKLKKELATLDVVIVAAEYGHGKRAGVLSDYTFAVKSEDGLKVIGKAYSGLTDKEIDEMTKILSAITVKDLGHLKIVEPKIVLEVAFNNIQKSNRHSSGYALRFPRIKRVRWDKNVDEIDTIDRVKEIYEIQAYKKML
ncbi:MAG: ATP-dependent DNA ligase [Nitrososphaerales archaeon]